MTTVLIILGAWTVLSIVLGLGLGRILGRLND